MATGPIRSFRADKGMTLEAFASAFGVNKSTALRWEEGRVPAERVLSISSFTGISPRDLRPDLYPDEARA